MEVKCKNCGAINTVNAMGRKRLPIPFNNICNALQYHSEGRLAGKPHLRNTAKKIMELYGVEITAGFVLIRLQREARDRGITYDELLAQIMPKGKTAARLEHMKKIM